MAVLQLFLAIFLSTAYSSFTTEVQTVILRCLTGLKSDWFKDYDTKRKYFHFWFFAILYKNTLLHFLHFFILCHNFCTNQDSDSLSTSKYLPESHFCQRKPYSWQKKWLDTVVKCSSTSCYILKVSQACPRPQFTSEAIILEPIII